MMRSVLNWASVVILAASVSFVGWLGFTQIESRTGEEDIAFRAFPQGKAITVEFDTSSPSYQALSQREKKEQQLDWLLYAVATSSDLPAVEIEQALYDLPPVRTDALAHLASPDTGDGRSRVLGSKKAAVVALIPKGDVSTQADLLADIVDEQRKNTGEIPEQFHVFEYELLSDGEAAQLVYVGVRPGQSLFEPDAGYVEQRVRTLDDLEKFIKATDDIVAARLDGATLIVGGRKLKAHRILGVGVEEIASIWQSSRKDPDSLGFSLDPQIDSEKLRVNFAKYGVTRSSGPATNIATPSLRVLDDELPQSLLRRPGRSSRDDPQFLRQRFQRSDTDVMLTEYREAYFQSQRFKGLPDKDLEAEFRNVVMDSQFQKARYIGGFQGTEVGMVLFYTDLLMKLWGQDQLRSTPRAIVEFPNELTLNPSAIHAAEARRLGGTRLWLGPRESAFQKDHSVNGLYLARVGTRLFAVPHDSIGNHDLKEAEPNVFDRVYIDWWNRHYSEVARYEPQYERLNEIVKWSVIVAWLQAQGRSSTLGVLEEVKPPNDFWFPSWARSHPELTFRKWDQLGFLEKGHGGSSTEALEIQHSDLFQAFGNPTWHFSGGVSLGGKTKLQELPSLSKDLTMAARRGGMKTLETEHGVWKLSYEAGKSVEIREGSSAVASSVVTPPNTVRLRGFTGEVKASKFERIFVREAEGVTLRARNGEASLGELRVTRTGNGLRAGWKARDLDTAYAIAKDISGVPSPETALFAHPDVVGVMRPNSAEYLVQLRGSKQWIHFSKRSELSEDVAQGFMGRASDGPTAPIVDFGLVDPAEVQVRLASLHYVEVRPTGPASDGISIVEAARPPPHAEKISLQAGGRSVQAFSDGDRILLNWQSLPPDMRANLGQLSGALRKDIAVAHPMPMPDEFASHSYSRIANRIAEDPASFRRSLNDSLDAQLRRNIELWKSGRFDELQDQLAIGERYVSDLPEFRLQKALVQLERGQPNAAARTINLGVRWPMTRTGGFLNEIEARLADPRVSAQQRANLRALTNYAELSTRTKPGTRLGAEAENGEIHVRLETEEVRKVKYSFTDERDLPQAVIYVEDHPSLNTADWSPSSAPSRLKDWVKSGRVNVEAIQDIDLAAFTPSKLVETKSGTKYHLVRSNAASHISTASRARCSGDNSTEESGGPCLALLVRQRPQAPANH